MIPDMALINKYIFQIIIFGSPIVTKALIFMGCYWGDQGIILENNITANSTIDCLQKCSSYKYVATQPLTKCRCGDVFIPSIKASCAECVLPCSPGRNMCGAYSRYVVYNIGGSSLGNLADLLSEVQRITCDPVTTDVTALEFDLTTTVQECVNQNSTLNSTKPAISTSEGMANTSKSHNDCMCPCKSLSGKWNLSRYQLNEQLQAELVKIEESLRIDPRKTSAYLRTKGSASDNRVSSKIMGCIGVSMIVLSICIIVSCDLMRVVTKRNQTKTYKL